VSVQVGCAAMVRNCWAYRGSVSLVAAWALSLVVELGDNLERREEKNPLESSVSSLVDCCGWLVEE